MKISINAPRAGCDLINYDALVAQLNISIYAPRAGCDSKTIQSKYVLVVCRMYSFANYVLHTLKNSLTYCIGITLQPLLFGAKLPEILC